MPKPGSEGHGKYSHFSDRLRRKAPRRYFTFTFTNNVFIFLTDLPRWVAWRRFAAMESITTRAKCFSTVSLATEESSCFPGWPGSMTEICQQKVKGFCQKLRSHNIFFSFTNCSCLFEAFKLPNLVCFYSN